MMSIILGIHIYAQNDTLKNEFGLFVNVYTGPVFFPQTYGPLYPSFVAGAGIALSLGTTELEFGGSYAPLFYDTKHTGENYQKVSYSLQNVKFNLYAHQKIFQVKKHIISLRAGIEMIINYGVNTDTLMNDGTHHRNIYVRNGYFDRKIGLNIYAGLRYSYWIKRKWILFAEPFFTLKAMSEFGWSGGGHAPHYGPVYDGRTEFLSTSVKFGFVYLISKDIPRFYVKMPKKKK